jgi:VWFA-related protein
VRGNTPVGDLFEQDLRVYDNNRPQKIVSFEKAGVAGAVSASSGDLRGRATDRPAPLIYILLDALNTSFADQIFGREGVARMLGQRPDGVRIEILALGEQLHLLHSISTDYEELRWTVEKYEGEQPVGWTPELNNRPIRVASPQEALDERRRITGTLQAMADIARDARARPGEKNLIWVSSAIPTQFTSRIGGATVPEDYHKEVAQAMRKLVAAGIALYPVSPQGLKPVYTDGMIEMAELTGGKALLLSNDVAGLVREAMDEPKENYLVTYVPAEGEDDGSFHEIRMQQRGEGSSCGIGLAM